MPIARWFRVLGDIIAQHVVEKRDSHDYVRTLRLTGFGGVVAAPLLSNWYRFLDKHIHMSTPFKGIEMGTGYVSACKEANVTIQLWLLEWQWTSSCSHQVLLHVSTITLSNWESQQSRLADLITYQSSFLHKGHWKERIQSRSKKN